MAVESALPPVGLLLAHNRRMAAVTLACTPSPICTAAAHLPASFPAPYPYRAPDSLRPAKWRKPLTGPLPWNSLTTTRIRTRLPIDDLAHLVLRYVPATGIFPPRLQHLVPSDFGAPDPPPITWSALRARVTLSLSEEWASRPLPDYYSFTPSLSPHPFMGLPKFLAGRIHQLRSGKSYLAAHRPDWCQNPVIPTCPRCSSGEETFAHAVFECPPASGPGSASSERSPLSPRIRPFGPPLPSLLPWQSSSRQRLLDSPTTCPPLGPIRRTRPLRPPPGRRPPSTSPPVIPMPWSPRSRQPGAQSSNSAQWV